MSGIKTIKKWIVPILMLVFYGILRKKMVHYIINYRSADFSKSLLIGDFVIIIVLVLLIKLVFKDNFNSIDSAKKMSLKKSVLISVLMVVVYIVTMFCINRVTSFIFNPKSIISNNTARFIADFKVNPLPLIGISFVTSTLEEIVYRQMLFGYLYDLHKGCNKYIRFITSALISSVVFGI
ncbi:MAG: CPBP family intramembrane metalloprotease, partial [Peptoniphilaceae bacterium]|uniref:CPBP family intramembrane glutamate endopeptidase n=1 Tax=Parvimonas sp. TaxID=1944660 RepID=UPI002A7626F8